MATATTTLTAKNIKLGDIFGEKFASSQMTINGFEPSSHPLVKKQNPDYVWDSSMARDLTEWASDPNRDPLWITGPTGCGKTELLVQFFAGLNLPCVVVSAKSSTEPDDIMGRVQLREGNTVFVPGDLLKAYSKGHAIVFDEIDAYPSEVIMACHRMLERAVVTLDDGTVVRPGKNLYMAATANTRGDGQGGDQYAATNVINIASLDRFEKWEMRYPIIEVEKEILVKALPQHPVMLLEAMAKVAKDIRVSYVQGNCPVPISIRSLIRWGRKLITCQSRSDIQPIYHSFDKAFGNGVDRHVRSMLHTIVESHMGVPVPAMNEEV